MLRRKAKWTIDALADESVRITIKSKNINNLQKRSYTPNRSISTIGDVNTTIIEACRQIERRSNSNIPLSIRGGK